MLGSAFILTVFLCGATLYDFLVGMITRLVGQTIYNDCQDLQMTTGINGLKCFPRHEENLSWWNGHPSTKRPR